MGIFMYPNDDPIIMGENLQNMLNTYFGLVRQVSRILDFEEENLSLQEIRIIEYVGEVSESTMGHLCEHFPLPASTATRYVDKLVKGGYLLRERLETDRRQVQIRLSQKAL
ncbi:MAG: MarR family winged helix-turn-helix transcriptional regulator, partial [Candidatus Thorarchaeota archaeon]